MSSREKTVEYKGNKYCPTKLLNYYADSCLQDFKDGDVTNVNTGEIFEISELKHKYKDSLKNTITDDNLLLGIDFENARSKSANKLIRDIEKNEYEEKFKSGDINLDDIRSWISLMSRSERESFGILRYDNFININANKGKPDCINWVDYGKFNALVRLINYTNRLKHSNGREIRKKDIMKELGFDKSRSYDNFISRLKKAKMIVKTDVGDDKFIIVNPAYAMKNMKLDITTYNYFKEDLDELLTELEIKYLQLLAEDGNINHMIKVITT